MLGAGRLDRLQVATHGSLVAARDRAGEGVGAAVGPIAGAAQHQRAELAATVLDTGALEQLDRRLLERDQEVRRDRGGRVVDGAALLGKLGAPHPQALGERAGELQGFRGRAADRAGGPDQVWVVVGDRLQGMKAERSGSAGGRGAQRRGACGAAGMADEAQAGRAGDRLACLLDRLVGDAEQDGLRFAGGLHSVVASRQPRVDSLGSRRGVDRTPNAARSDDRERRDFAFVWVHFRSSSRVEIPDGASSQTASPPAAAGPCPKVTADLRL
jgi:hypothetical protein